MDLQEQVLQLSVETLALDQSYVFSPIKESVILRKQLILKDKVINDLNEQLQKLLKEKESEKYNNAETLIWRIIFLGFIFLQIARQMILLFV